ncbi:11447_t:CDS:2 [Paraglomus brasilianum]|uniref:11447_t:CDS:1 n=1 Tax=Paraglomus brasilianum TaxID=144538 RepID=A0A9N9C4Z2_9GLOM|nr:11447_t:CDS:2 [Paraglomus brasilianum]
MPKLKIIQTTGYSRRSHPYGNRKPTSKNKTTPVATKLVTTMPTVTSGEPINIILTERSNVKKGMIEMKSKLKTGMEPELKLKSKLPTYVGKSQLEQSFGLYAVANSRKIERTPRKTQELEHREPKSDSPNRCHQKSLSFRLLVAGRSILSAQAPSSGGTQNDLRKALAKLAKRCRRIDMSEMDYKKPVEITPSQARDGKGILKHSTSNRNTPKKTVNFAPYSQVRLYERDDYIE